MSCSALTPPEQFYYLRYLILDVLGQGTFGQVVKCQDMKTHEIVAVKVVKNKPAYFNQSMMEVTILELVCLYFGSSFVSIDRGFIAQQSV
jgi:serine/threonine protein kinase